MSDNDEDEDQKYKKNSPKKDEHEATRSEEKGDKASGQAEKEIDKSPRKSENSKKRKPEKDPDDEDHEIKRRMEFESWEDFDDLMRARIPKGNDRTRGEGPSDLVAGVWPEIWQGDIEREYKRNFCGK